MKLVAYNNHFPATRSWLPETDRWNGLLNELFQMDQDYSPLQTPSANIRETDEQFEIELAVPGYQKDALKIETEKNLLRIYSETEKKETEEQNYRYREFAYGNFTKTFVLPRSVNIDAIGAEYQQGILKVYLPKHEEFRPKPPRQIDIA